MICFLNVDLNVVYLCRSQMFMLKQTFYWLTWSWQIWNVRTFQLLFTGRKPFPILLKQHLKVFVHCFVLFVCLLVCFFCHLLLNLKVSCTSILCANVLFLYLIKTAWNEWFLKISLINSDAFSFLFSFCCHETVSLTCSYGLCQKNRRFLPA